MLNPTRFGILISLLAAELPAIAQTGTPNGQWRYYGGDDRNTRYSPQDQINEQNVSVAAPSSAC